MKTERETVLAYIQAINSHDVKRVLSLMADDYSFVDAYGETASREQMKTGWPGYFDWFPDYRIEVEQLMEADGSVGVFGYAGGTFRGRKDGKGRWRLPAAWWATAREGKIVLWQVYCDSKIPFAAMEE